MYAIFPIVDRTEKVRMGRVEDLGIGRLGDALSLCPMRNSISLARTVCSGAARRPPQAQKGRSGWGGLCESDGTLRLLRGHVGRVDHDLGVARHGDKVQFQLIAVTVRHGDIVIVGQDLPPGV